MPYIKADRRLHFDKVLIQLDVMTIENKGELEYCIFKLMQMYMRKKEVRYSNLHDTVYAAHHCGDEFRRRFLDKREDEAIKENGDVIAVFDPGALKLIDSEEDITDKKL